MTDDGRDAPGRSFWIGIAAATLVGAVLRFWALDLGLPHTMARPDEEMIVDRTRWPALGRWDLEWAVYPSAYVYLVWAWGALGLRVGQALGAFPQGDYLAVLQTAPEHVFLVDRVLSALAGTLTVPALAVIARRSLGPVAASAAAWILATSFLHARDSHAIKPDALMALLVVVALGAMLPLARGATVRRGMAAGLAIGLAMAAKYPAVALVPSAWVAAVLGSRARGWRRVVPASAVAAGATAGVVFAATSPFLLLNERTVASMLVIVSWVFPQLVPPARPTLPPGVTLPEAPSIRWWEGLGYHATFSLRYGMGLAATAAAPLALVWAAAARRPLATVSVVFLAVYFVMMGVSPAMHARYMTPIVPVLALLEGGLVAAVAARLAPRRRGLLAAALTAALAAEPLAAAVAHDRIAARTDTRVLATRWLAEHLPPDARLAVLGARVWIWGAPDVPPGMQVPPAEPTPEGLRAAGVRWVVTHDHVLFSSRTDPDVMARLAPHLRLLAEFDPFAPGGRDRAVFEAPDAYYIPMSGFDGVVRPGPHIRIYAFE